MAAIAAAQHFSTFKEPLPLPWFDNLHYHQPDDTTSLLWICLALVVTLYLASEVAFYFYFHWHMIPNANRRTTPEIYHDYPQVQDRVLLLRRIILRLEQKALRIAKRANQEDSTHSFQKVCRDFLLQWFERLPNEAEQQQEAYKTSKPAAGSIINTDSHPPGLTLLSISSTVSSNSSASSGSSSSSSSSCGDSSSIQSSSDEFYPSSASTSPTSGSHAPWTITGLNRRALQQFFSWAFFAKEMQDLTKPEQAALEDCFHTMRELTGLVFPDYPQALYEPRRLSLEDMQALHRPWVVYAAIASLQWVLRNALLPWLGFQRVKASNVALVAWHRPAASGNSQKDVCLFFHGIAPAGVICYMPMIQALLGKRQQSLVMFENPSVSCQFQDFDSLTEEETVSGVRDVLHQLNMSTRRHRLTLMGHSFGSCPISWILRRRRQFAARIHHVVLLDPVTLLLSEPTVMSQFLYERGDRSKAHIRFLVGSELFTEYYLRRHFAWYNSELWLEDFCGNSGSKNSKKNNPKNWTIVLSGNDEIVPSPVVEDYVSSLQSNGLKNCNLVYWEHSKHANCVMSPRRWGLMRNFLFHKSKQQ